MGAGAASQEAIPAARAVERQHGLGLALVRHRLALEDQVAQAVEAGAAQGLALLRVATAVVLGDHGRHALEVGREQQPDAAPGRPRGCAARRACGRGRRPPLAAGVERQQRLLVGRDGHEPGPQQHEDSARSAPPPREASSPTIRTAGRSAWCAGARQLLSRNSRSPGLLHLGHQQRDDVAQPSLVHRREDDLVAQEARRSSRIRSITSARLGAPWRAGSTLRHHSRSTWLSLQTLLEEPVRLGQALAVVGQAGEHHRVLGQQRTAGALS